MWAVGAPTLCTKTLLPISWLEWFWHLGDTKEIAGRLDSEMGLSCLSLQIWHWYMALTWHWFYEILQSPVHLTQGIARSKVWHAVRQFAARGPATVIEWVDDVDASRHTTHTYTHTHIIYIYIYNMVEWYDNTIKSKASVAMAVAICIWQEVSSSHSDAANTALAANMLARMVLATAPQLRCTVSLTHSLTHSLSLSLSLSHSCV